MKERTISGVKIPERVEKYIRKLKYKYILLNTIKNPTEKKLIEEEYKMNPYASATLKEESIQSFLSISQSKAFKRLLNKTMAHPSTNLSSDKTVKRMMHSISAAGLMLEYCSALHLNKELGMAIALGHDVGHTAFGHEGEKIFKDIALENNIGTYAHNLQGRLLLNYIDKVNTSPDVYDGVQCHNGEKEEFEVPVNYDKTEQDSLNDLIDCLAYPGKEREQIPGTFEGAAFRIIDKISYVGQDLADGFREGILNPRNLDPELISILEEIGLDKKRINEVLSQDKTYSLEIIDRIIEQLENFPISSMTPEETKKDFEECIKNLRQLHNEDFYNGPRFNELLSKTANKMHSMSKSVNLGTEDTMRLLSDATDLDKLMSQDTSGGKLAREIEKIFMTDFINNSKNKDHPCMSEKMGDLMYDLIGYTQETVLPKIKGTSENNELLKNTINNLVNHYTNVLLASGVVDEIISQIETNYKEEEKNTHKESGVFDDEETLKIDSKIVGHTRKLFAQNKEYFEIVLAVIKELNKNPNTSIELTFREKVAKRIAIDYTSRNNEIKLIKKAKEKGVITANEAKKLNTSSKTKTDKIFEILPSMNLYETRVGMHNDRMQSKIDKLSKCRDFLTSKEIPQDNDLINSIDASLIRLNILKEEYNTEEIFKEKKTLFKRFKIAYKDIISNYINQFRKSLNKNEQNEFDEVLKHNDTMGAPDVAKWDEEAKKQAEEAIQER